MNEESIIIESIQKELKTFEPKYIGKIRLNSKTNCLTLLDGKLAIESKFINDSENPEMVHVHVISRIDSFPDVKLDACVVGFGENREEALVKAGIRWVNMAGFPILSLCHAVGLGPAVHFSGEEVWGVKGCHGFVGPIGFSHFNMSESEMDIVYESPMFENVAELSPSGPLHLAKAVISSNGKGGWKRNLEIDGHKAEYMNESWDPGIPHPDSGYAIISQYVIYHYFDKPEFVQERQLIDDAINEYMKILKEDSTIDPDSVSDILVQKGHGADLAFWMHHFLPLAFINIQLMNTDVVLSDEYFVGRKGGTISKGYKLIKNTIYARAYAMGLHFCRSEEYHSSFEKAAYSSAVVHTLNKYLETHETLDGLTTHPTLIPEAGLSDDDLYKTIETFVAHLQSKKSD